MRNTIYRFFTDFPVRFIAPRALRSMGWKLVWTGTFNNRFADKEYAIDVYNKHNERVQQIVPKDRLLVLDVTKNGRWDELCQFLEVPVPDVPFPRSHETKDAEKMLKKMNKMGWTMIIGASVVVALVGVGLYYRMK
jgi:hypothetical protein